MQKTNSIQNETNIGRCISESFKYGDKINILFIIFMKRLYFGCQLSSKCIYKKLITR
jgi:hypothetical protein